MTRELWAIEYVIRIKTGPPYDFVYDAEWLPTGECFSSERFAKEVARRETNGLRNRIRERLRGKRTIYRAVRYVPAEIERSA